MKKNTVGILLGMTLAAAFFAGCGSNEATETANESAELEQAGEGESPDTEVTEETEESDAEEESGQEAGNTEDEEEPEEPAVRVGVLLPDSDEGTWFSDGQELQADLEASGYEAELVFAEGDCEKQITQIEDMISEEIPALIITPVDEYGLTEILSETKEKGIYVFSYDKLIRDTAGVNYYTTFSGRSIGKMIAKEIVKEQELDKVKEAGESRTIEFLMGSLDDSQALFLYNGVMEILQPYLDDGTLVCRSGQTSFEDTGILRWGRERAEKRMQSILDEFYQDTELPDIICTGFDDAACGAADVLEERGFVPSDEYWPMITGCGCEIDAVRYLVQGKISCSIFMNRSNLAEKCVEMVDTCLKGEKPETNDYQEYDNGKKIISTYLCDAQLINEGNYESLIDSGYYQSEEILPEAEGENGDMETSGDSEETGEQEPAGEQENVGTDEKQMDSENTEGNPSKEIPEDSILSILGNTREGL